jgi:DNA-binding beta-propeller fold protein YncE
MGSAMTTSRVFLALLVLCLAPAAASAEILLPPGFTMQVYVTGEGFDTSDRGVKGVPAASTVAVDGAGVLYLARPGRRFSGGEIDDLWPVYRFPAGGGRVTKATEPRFLYGPPLPSAQIAGVRAGRDLLVTTFDRDRKLGALYVMADGFAELLAGGTPPAGSAPLFVQPESAAVDRAGNVYVADRERNRVVKLGPRGAVLAESHLTVRRPRLLSIGGDGALWVASDGGAEAPWQRGPGEIWRVAGDAAPVMLLRGPVASGMDVTPAGQLFVADRQASEIFVLGPDGKRLPFARFTDGDAPRGLAFAPVTPATERAGIAGSLFLISISKGAWPVNEVVRISGPFEQFVREGAAAR